jgi:hypothetical protein
MYFLKITVVKYYLAMHKKIRTLIFNLDRESLQGGERLTSKLFGNERPLLSPVIDCDSLGHSFRIK